MKIISIVIIILALVLNLINVWFMYSLTLGLILIALIVIGAMMHQSQTTEEDIYMLTFILPFLGVLSFFRISYVEDNYQKEIVSKTNISNIVFYEDTKTIGYDINNSKGSRQLSEIEFYKLKSKNHQNCFLNEYRISYDGVYMEFDNIKVLECE